MGSLYVVSGRDFYRAFSIATEEEVGSVSIHHNITNVKSFLDQVWPFASNLGGDTQHPDAYEDGQIGDVAAIVVTYTDATSVKKLYKRNFGVGEEYTWTEKTD
jgi:hypothetical protein